MLKKPILFIVAGTVLAAILCLILINRPRRLFKIGIDPSEIASYLEDGDILCRLGDRVWSRYFSELSTEDKRFSHLGIVRIRNGNITVINAEGQTAGRGDSVNETPIHEFLQYAKTAGIYRANFTEGTIISDTAMEFIGYPFDWNFNLDDKSKIYCTELLYVILEKASPEIELRMVFFHEIGRKIIPVEAISDSKDFTEILYISADK